MIKRPTYCGSMRHDTNGSYSYRGFRIAKIQGGWEIQHGAARSLGIGAHFGHCERVTERETRNEAGSYVDRYLYRETKARNAARSGR